MFNPTSDELLVYIRYKRILQVCSDSRSAQSIINLGTTRCQLTNRVGQALLINRKQPEKALTRNQDN